MTCCRGGKEAQKAQKGCWIFNFGKFLERVKLCGKKKELLNEKQHFPHNLFG